MTHFRRRSRGHRGRAFAGIVACAITGCGEGGVEYASSEVSMPPSSPQPDSMVAFRNPGPENAPQMAGMGMPGMNANQEAGEPVPPAIPRKIIYDASVTLVVEDSNAAGERIEALVKESGGYLSETNVTGNPSSQRRATWKVRVPVESFQSFLGAVSRLGELQESRLNSQDVTQEYYDLEARIANKLIEEKRLVKHLEDSTGKLEDILVVEREISRVRGEVEQMQGRIRYLANVTALSTITISVVEVQNYVPPVAPTFATKVARTFQDSLANLTEFLQAAALTVVALAPWLPLIAVGVLAAWGVARAVRRRPRAEPPPR